MNTTNDDPQGRTERRVRPGESWRIVYGDGHMMNCVVHIRAIVDEEIVVFRKWHKRHKCWDYHAEHEYFFQIRFERDQMRKLRSNTAISRPAPGADG